jgi:hypothetical protein
MSGWNSLIPCTNQSVQEGRSRLLNAAIYDPLNEVRMLECSSENDEGGTPKS